MATISIDVARRQAWDSRLHDPFRSALIAHVKTLGDNEALNVVENSIPTDLWTLFLGVINRADIEEFFDEDTDQYRIDPVVVANSVNPEDIMRLVEGGHAKVTESLSAKMHRVAEDLSELRFGDLEVGDRFVFASENSVEFRFSGMAKGPWEKISYRKYSRVDDPDRIHSVGTVRVPVRRIRR